MASIKKNLMYLTGAQAIGYILPLLTLPYLSRVLSPGHFGILGLCQAIVQYFMIVTDYGFNITATKEISQNRTDKTKISIIFSSTIAAKIFLLLLSFLGLVVSWMTIKTVAGYELLLICCFVGVIGNAFYPLWLFQGLELMKIPVIYSSLAKLLLLAAIFVFVKSDHDLNIAAILLNGGNLLAGILGLIYVRYKRIVCWSLPDLKNTFFVLKEGWPVFLSTVAISFYTTFNTVLLSYKVSSAEIGYYNAADKMRIAIQSLFGPITQAFYPRIVHLYINDKKQAFSLIKKGLLLMLCITIPCAIFLFLLSDYIIVYYLNKNYMQSSNYLKLLSFLPVIICVATAYCNWGLLGIGLGNLVSKIYISYGLLHFVYAIPLIIFFKVYGLIISVYITQLLITVSTMFYFYKRVYKINV